VSSPVQERLRTDAAERTVAIVDTDVHLAPMPNVLVEFMPEATRSRIGADFRRLMPRQCYLTLGGGLRLDAFGPNGEIPGTDKSLTKQHLFVDEKMDFGIMTPVNGGNPDPDLNAAGYQALNAWQVETWLDDEDQRLFGSICAGIDDPDRAVEEIERWGAHPGFKQVLLQPDGDRPFGHRMYDKVWEAAARHDLPVALHFNESGRLQMGVTPTGRFGTYLEYHAIAHPLESAAHMVSWICSGVFSRLPNFRVAFLESGFLWHRPVIARLQRQWEAKSGYLADAGLSPLEALRGHVRFASQPLETAPSEKDLIRRLELAEADRLLMYSSDYPHYDYDAADVVLPKRTPDELRRRIMSENAREFYRLPGTRPAGRFDEADA
jgi:uncharacterized protein